MAGDSDRATYEMAGDSDRATYEMAGDSDRATYEMAGDSDRATYEMAGDSDRATYEMAGDSDRALRDGGRQRQILLHAMRHYDPSPPKHKKGFAMTLKRYLVSGVDNNVTDAMFNVMLNMSEILLKHSTVHNQRFPLLLFVGVVTPREENLYRGCAKVVLKVNGTSVFFLMLRLSSKLCNHTDMGVG